MREGADRRIDDVPQLTGLLNSQGAAEPSDPQVSYGEAANL